MGRAVGGGVLAGLALSLGGCGSQFASDFERDFERVVARVSGETYGAVAVSDQTQDWRIYWDAVSPEDASRRALAESEHASCRVLVDFGPSECGTVALGPDGFFGGVGRTGPEAESNARASCSAGGADCKVAPAACNS